MPGTPGQILGELGELGKQTVTEIAKTPVDIVGTALETLGTASGKKGQPQVNSNNTKDSRNLEKQGGPLKEFSETSDQKTKQTIARAALVQLAGRANPHEPSVWERLQTEEEQKKEQNKKFGAVSAMGSLPVGSSKPRRGNLWGVHAKKTATENKATRQD